MLVKLENGTNVSVPNTTIDNYVNKYNLTKEEAVTLWLEDNEYISNPVVEELEKKAKKNKISRDARKISTKTEKRTREKKENPVKKEIIGQIYNLFKVEYGDIMTISLRNDEKYIDLTIEDRNFTINLVEHRKRESD